MKKQQPKKTFRSVLDGRALNARELDMVRDVIIKHREQPPGPLSKPYYVNFSKGIQAMIRLTAKRHAMTEPEVARLAVRIGLQLAATRLGIKDLKPIRSPKKKVALHFPPKLRKQIEARAHSLDLTTGQYLRQLARQDAANQS